MVRVESVNGKRDPERPRDRFRELSVCHNGTRRMRPISHRVQLILTDLSDSAARSGGIGC